MPLSLKRYNAIFVNFDNYKNGRGLISWRNFIFLRLYSRIGYNYSTIKKTSFFWFIFCDQN